MLYMLNSILFLGCTNTVERLMLVMMSVKVFQVYFLFFLLLYLVLSAICIKKVLDSHVPF